MTLQYRRQKRTIAATDIDKPAKTGKVIGLEHRLRFRTVMSGHRFIEHDSAIWLLRKEFEGRHSKRFDESCFAAANRIRQFGPGLIQLLSMKSRIRTLAAVAAQRFGKRS